MQVLVTLYLASFPGLPTVQIQKYTASHQKLDGGKAWGRGYIVLLAGTPHVVDIYDPAAAMVHVCMPASC